MFPVPSILESQFRKDYGIQRIGGVRNVRGHFYAISGERKLQHPAVVAIREAARQELFS